MKEYSKSKLNRVKRGSYKGFLWCRKNQFDLRRRFYWFCKLYFLR